MLTTAFLTGLIGSIHCIGMCGPLAVVANRLGRNQSVGNALIYNGSRIGVYLLLGVVFGSFGQVAIASGFQKWLSMALGVVILLFAVILLIKPQFNHYLTAQFGFAFKLLGKFNRPERNGPANIMMLGAINGLLPCGLVYMAIAGALIQVTLTDAALYMLVFGLGTLPLMFSMSHSAVRLLNLVKGSYQKVLSFGLLFFGVFLLYRGWALELSDPVQYILDPTQGIVDCE